MAIPIHIQIKIAWLMSIVKLIIGFRILSLGGESNSITLLLGGTFLMMGGMMYVVPRIFDEIEYRINKSRDAKRGNNE